MSDKERAFAALDAVRDRLLEMGKQRGDRGTPDDQLVHFFLGQARMAVMVERDKLSHEWKWPIDATTEP